jgi:hypothetical protein
MTKQRMHFKKILLLVFYLFAEIACLRALSHAVFSAGVFVDADKATVLSVDVIFQAKVQKRKKKNDKKKKKTNSKKRMFTIFVDFCIWNIFNN